MQLASQSVLRTITIVLMLVVVGLAVLLVFTFVQDVTDTTPRTELERAVLAAEEAVRANPEDPAARQKLAAAYLDSNSIGSAREQADIAIRLDPADPTGYYILGLTQKKAGDIDVAVVTLERAATTEGQLAQFYQDVHFALALAYEESGDTEKALVSFNEAINNNPENAIMIFERAKFYERQELWADAMYDYSITLTYDTSFPGAEDSYRRLADKYPDAAAQAQQWLSEWNGTTDDTSEPAGR